jgi:hypothetical protein
VAEALVLVVGKRGEFSQQDGENVLDEIGGVGGLQAHAASPKVQERRVQIDEAWPGALLIGAAQSFEQAGRGLVHGRQVVFE